MHQDRLVPRRSQKYDDAFAAVRHVVNKWDPEALIEIGAPGDEYDQEVTDLVRMVLRSEQFRPADVEAAWHRWFGDDHGMRGKTLKAVTEDLDFLQRRFAKAEDPPNG
jgi:hypothetical protein